MNSWKLRCSIERGKGAVRLKNEGIEEDREPDSVTLHKGPQIPTSEGSILGPLDSGTKDSQAGLGGGVLT